MTQVTHGIRSILSHPFFYSGFQSLMGAHASRTRFTSNYVKPVKGMRILDVGCGPADIFAYLPETIYFGFDISQDYINRARLHFGSKAEFSCKHLTLEDIQKLPPFDVVLALGLLHHLNDDEATDIMRLARSALKPGGRLLTIDPCWDVSQSLAAKILIKNDRGQNVRDRAGYENLTKSVFNVTQSNVVHTKWIPYTHCVMQCSL